MWEASQRALGPNRSARKRNFAASCPVIAAVASRISVPISVDTTKAAVAERALDAGAAIVNDISGLLFDRRMPEVCAGAQAGVVCMHMQGTPQTMQIDPRYEDVVREVADYLAQRLAALEECGIARERVVLDPGIGFGKTPADNLTLLKNVSRFRALGRPVMIGHSRKRFLAKILGRSLDEASAATIGVALAAALSGADVLRVHDVRAVRDALAACWAVLGDSGAERSDEDVRQLARHAVERGSTVTLRRMISSPAIFKTSE